MKGLKYSEKLKKEASSLTSNFNEIIELYCNKINKEYQKKMHALLENIAKGEGLDLTMLQNKYLKKSEIESEINSNEDEQILNKITYKNETYYVDMNNNIVYDASSIIVGKYNNNIIEFTN